MMYLQDRDVIALSEAIKRPEVAWWMLDFAFQYCRRKRLLDAVAVGGGQQHLLLLAQRRRRRHVLVVDIRIAVVCG